MYRLNNFRLGKAFFITLSALTSFCLLGCGAIANPITPTPESTATPPATKQTILPTATKALGSTATTTITPTATEEPKIVEVAEENREQINEYFARVFWGVNRDRTDYWQQIEVKSEADLIDYLKANDWTLPVTSEDSNVVLFFFKSIDAWGGHEDSLRIKMDKPLVVAPEITFISPSTAKTAIIPNGQSFPNLDPEEDNTVPEVEHRWSVSLGVNVDQSEEKSIKTIKFTIVWRDERYDLEGNPYAGDQETIKRQASQLAERYFNFLWSFNNFGTSISGQLAKQVSNWYGWDFTKNEIRSATPLGFLQNMSGKWDQVPADQMPPQIFK